MNMQVNPLCVTTTACRDGVAAAELFPDASVRLFLNCEYVGSGERDDAGRIENLETEITSRKAALAKKGVTVIADTEGSSNG